METPVTFDDIPVGAMVFIDANCLIYAATSDPTYGAACQRLLTQVEIKVFQGCTSAYVLGELAHRLMTIEAAMLFSRPMSGMANWLRRHPDEVKQLSQYQKSIDDLQAIAVGILPITGSLVSRAADLSRLFGLLTNDALVVAFMQDQGLTQLASNDADFDRVPGLIRYAAV
jgi:predicted nucleic acid-binding protein